LGGPEDPCLCNCGINQTVRNLQGARCKRFNHLVVQI